MTADDELLAMLRARPLLTVYDGFVDVDESAKVINVPLPYVVFYSSPGFDNDARFSGQVGGRVLEFQITGVGRDRRQAKWVLDEARSALSRKRLRGNLIMRDDDNLPVRRDDDYSRPGGKPVFYGVDIYTVAV